MTNKNTVIFTCAAKKHSVLLSHLHNLLWFACQKWEETQCFLESLAQWALNAHVKNTLDHCWMLLVGSGASLGLFLLTLVVPSGIFGVHLASLWISLEILLERWGSKNYAKSQRNVILTALPYFYGPSWPSKVTQREFRRILDRCLAFFCIVFCCSLSWVCFASCLLFVLLLFQAFRYPLSLQVYSGKRASSWRCVVGFPLGKEWEGESPRGGERLPA